ncbi:hypothetical protein ACVIWU_000808 [Bradyrhizobium sp. USDA 4509]
MLILRDLHERNKPPVLRPIFDCFIDTLIVYFPTTALAREDWTRLRKIYGDTPHHHQNADIGYMLIGFQCPQRELLHELALLGKQCGGKLYRLDIGCDARIDEDYTVEEQHRFLKEHMLLMHRNGQRILEIPNADGTTGCYYCPHAHIQGAPRDICLYWGLSSKLDPYGELCAHFDLRLRGRPAKQFTLDGMETLNPSKIVLRHIRFVEFHQRRFERDLFRKRMQAMNLEDAKRQIALMRRLDQLDYVQRAHDQHRIRLHTNNDLVTLPGSLSWGAVRRKSKDQAIEREINRLGETFVF